MRPNTFDNNDGGNKKWNNFWLFDLGTDQGNTTKSPLHR